MNHSVLGRVLLRSSGAAGPEHFFSGGQWARRAVTGNTRARCAWMQDLPGCVPVPATCGISGFCERGSAVGNIVGGVGG